jgi:hypothetical protein
MGDAMIEYKGYTLTAGRSEFGAPFVRATHPDDAPGEWAKFWGEPEGATRSAVAWIDQGGGSIFGKTWPDD